VNSKIYVGTVSHTRSWPTVHGFSYPVYTYVFDLNELPALEKLTPFFGYNRLRPVAVYDRDYFEPEAGTIIEKTRRFLADHVSDPADIARVELVTSARFFNYVFNPVSFFYCYDTQNSLKIILAHVNNTFGETHVYILHKPLETDATSFTRYQIDKDFHVSPFFDREGRYDFHFKPLGDKLDIRITLIKEGKTVFTAQLAGAARPLNTGSLLKTIGRYPLSALLTMPRILWEAGKLYFQRSLPVYKKPVATSKFTIRKPAITRVQKWAMTMVFSIANQMEYGSLEMILPDRTTRLFGDQKAGPHQRLYIHDYRFFTRLVTAGDIGLGEGFTAGEWETDDLPGLISLLLINSVSFKTNRFSQAFSSFYKRLTQRWLYRPQKNSVTGSKKNIEAHYDLSNQMYSRFLDDTMTYSAAYFCHPDEPLECAQRNKLRMLINKAQIEPHHHVLEIGSGWGSFAIEAVKLTGCRVTTITISEAQYRLAKERIDAAGLADRIDIQLRDYRDLTSQFDRIVSIEMIEAVGHEYLPEYFKSVDRLLKPDGLFVLQAITFADQGYDRYRRDYDWIRKHIFPGGHLPSLQVISKTLTQHTTFIIDDLENIGQHYALTLARWRKRFLKNEKSIRALGFDEEFCRKWIFYFAYCEAGFATNHLRDIQLVLTRPRNPTLTRLAWQQDSLVTEPRDSS
jgi:cyclopropane-fatty-acyl-phospholipid synthase